MTDKDTDAVFISDYSEDILRAIINRNRLSIHPSFIQEDHSLNNPIKHSLWIRSYHTRKHIHVVTYKHML